MPALQLARNAAIQVHFVHDAFTCKNHEFKFVIETVTFISFFIILQCCFLTFAMISFLYC